MASLSIVSDVTKPLDTSYWLPHNKTNKVMTKEQREVTKIIEKAESNLARSAPADTDTVMEIENAIHWKLLF
jgi:hypothetical protein